MHINTPIKSQKQFIHQFAQQVQGQEHQCLSVHSVRFPDDIGLGKVSYVKNNYFSFIISDVLLKEELIYNSLDEIAKSKFVDFGLFANGQLESSFLTGHHKQFHLEVPSGVFQHFSMNIPRQLLPKNKSRKEILAAYQQFTDLHSVQTTIKELFTTQQENIVQIITMESKGMGLVGDWLRFLQRTITPQSMFKN